MCGGPVKGSYEGEVDAVKQYINKRFDTLTNIIDKTNRDTLLEKVETCWGPNGTWVECNIPY